MNEDDVLLSVKEVSEYVRVGPESIRRWLRDGKLSGVNLGRGAGWRIRRSDLEEMVEGHRTKARTEPEAPGSFESSVEDPAEIEVTCVTRERLQNPHTGVTHLGSRSRRWTRDQIIAAIDAGTHTFYSVTPAGRAEVAVYDGPFCRYLRARTDGQWNDVLLGLAECEH